MRRFASSWFFVVVPSQTFGQPSPQSVGSISRIVLGSFREQEPNELGRRTDERPQIDAPCCRHFVVKDVRPCLHRRCAVACLRLVRVHSSEAARANRPSSFACDRRVRPTDRAACLRATRSAMKAPRHSSGRMRSRRADIRPMDWNVASHQAIRVIAPIRSRVVRAVASQGPANCDSRPCQKSMRTKTSSEINRTSKAAGRLITQKRLEPWNPRRNDLHLWRIGRRDTEQSRDGIRYLSFGAHFT